MKIRITGVRTDNSGHFILDRVITDDDGKEELGVYVIPIDALEWRAAEYGISPDDKDTLFDVLIAEHHIDDDDVGPMLYDAETISEAREAHLARCARAKLRYRISTRGANHPANVVKEQSVMRADLLQDKRNFVSANRKELARMRKG